MASSTSRTDAAPRRPVFSNIFDNVPIGAEEEEFQVLAKAAGLTVERIVSHGHVTAGWYDQSETEFVCIVRGEAELLFEGDSAPTRMRTGTWVVIPPHVRHRVVWTLDTEPTIWLAMKWAS